MYNVYYYQRQIIFSEVLHKLIWHAPSCLLSTQCLPGLHMSFFLAVHHIQHCYNPWLWCPMGDNRFGEFDMLKSVRITCTWDYSRKLISMKNSFTSKNYINIKAKHSFPQTLQGNRDPVDVISILPMFSAEYMKYSWISTSVFKDSFVSVL